MRRALLGSLLFLAAVAGCAEEVPEHREPSTLTLAEGRGLSVDLPQGWQRSETSLTPSLSDPREVLSVATFPTADRAGRCAHMPGSALEDLGPADTFVTLQERGTHAGATGDGFPSRPARFGPVMR